MRPSDGLNDPQGAAQYGAQYILPYDAEHEVQYAASDAANRHPDVPNVQHDAASGIASGPVYQALLAPKRHLEIGLRLKCLLRNRLALAGVIIILLNLIIAIFAPVLSPYDPNVADPVLRLASIGTAGHPLGLDSQGRDLLSRVVWGGRSAFTVVVPAVFLACVSSLVIGLYAGYSRGRAATWVMRIIDILFAFPMILLAINLATTFGPGAFTVGVTVLFSALPYVTRVVYAEVRAERDKEYVEAAHALGASPFEIATKEILPNVLTSVIVYGTTLVGGMIVFLAGLSFLGLGIQPPTADWGRMVSEGAQVMLLGSAHVATEPALAIALLALGFNWFGDGLRDVLDARE